MIEKERYPGMEITRYDTLPNDMIVDAFNFHDRMMSPIDLVAAQRHTIWWIEFETLCRDERIGKYVGTDDNGIIVALGASTNDLDAVPLISTRFYEHRYPKLYARHAIWYVLFVAVDSRRAPGGYSAMITEMMQPMVRAEGIAALDLCAHNYEDRNLARGTYAIILRTAPNAGFHEDDWQRFIMYDFQNYGA